MNAKYVVALILALQVSVSLCDVPPPSQELEDKYKLMKETFIKRVQNLAGKAQEAATPYMEGAGDNKHAQHLKDFVEELQANPQFQTAVNLVTNLGGEAVPLVDQARKLFLGWYEQNLRPQYGERLDQAINKIKTFLDTFAPAE